ncbi:hypothetical protein N7516_011287 [Penicillium verrucosum]|uniref:uncharacterized protein n=1 Tax=Penicillium verrucosum TaxID=60171 RepID=UPI002544D321|nr:uncharacterized protein N7516_011287 [Penicillium verrucosum]KAJ5920429.1 hypothetical protein N7516_011287 [Penicillium verrucosum]
MANRQLADTHIHMHVFTPLGPTPARRPLFLTQQQAAQVTCRGLLCLGTVVINTARANKLSVNGDDRDDQQPMKHRPIQHMFKVPRSTLYGSM